MVNFGKNYESNICNDWKDYYFDYNKIKKITNRNDLANAENLKDILKLHDDEVNVQIDKINNFYNEQIQTLMEMLEVNKSDSKSSNELTEIKEDNLHLGKLIEECDKLRHFVIFNTISIVKIIKRRNKRTPSIVSTQDFLKDKDFYKCVKLNGIYTKLSMILKDKKIEQASEIMNDSMSLSLKTLKNLRDNHNICKDSYNLLPLYNHNKQTDEDLVKYLNDKLGPQNSMVIIDIDDNPKLSDIPNDNNSNLSKSRQISYSLSIPVLLYLFLFGLDLMSGSFKVLSGKGMNLLFSSIQNPVAGVMIGIISTVLLQSSSTTTSIVVAMTGSNIIDVKTAIPIIMGANIGTSVTNTLVSHAHIRNKEEFKKAFSGATVHDMFNYLSVLVLLPIEVISSALGYALLYNISDGITGSIVGTKAIKFKSPIKVILSPLTKLFVNVDKDVIKGIANGCLNCTYTQSTSVSNFTSFGCWDLKMKNCLTSEKWEEKYEDASIIKGGFLKGLGDIGGGVVGLILSLIVLCVALFFIVKFLNKLVLSSNGRGKIMRVVQKSLNISPYLTMIVGMLLTMAVQSSSIITSTFTPLVGLSILTVEQMFPLTLGSNIGTTFTAILASLVTESVGAIQIAICHFIFNIIGIAIWFPIPYTRKIPLNMAYRLGDLVSKYKWFGMFYILYFFVVTPLISWGISYLIAVDTAGLVFGIILITAEYGLSLLLMRNFEKVLEKILKVIGDYRIKRKRHIKINKNAEIELANVE